MDIANANINQNIPQLETPFYESEIGKPSQYCIFQILICKKYLKCFIFLKLNLCYTRYKIDDCTGLTKSLAGSNLSPIVARTALVCLSQ